MVIKVGYLFLPEITDDIPVNSLSCSLRVTTEGFAAASVLASTPRLWQAFEDKSARRRGFSPSDEHKSISDEHHDSLTRVILDLRWAHRYFEHPLVLPRAPHHNFRWAWNFPMSTEYLLRQAWNFMTSTTLQKYRFKELHQQLWTRFSDANQPVCRVCLPLFCALTDFKHWLIGWKYSSRWACVWCWGNIDLIWVMYCILGFHLVSKFIGLSNIDWINWILWRYHENCMLST